MTTWEWNSQQVFTCETFLRAGRVAGSKVEGWIVPNELNDFLFIDFHFSSVFINNSEAGLTTLLVNASRQPGGWGEVRKVNMYCGTYSPKIRTSNNMNVLTGSPINLQNFS